MLLAWYGGSGECQSDQSVHLLFINKRGPSKPLRLGDKTGNPVLWDNGTDEAVLLFSIFEDSGPMRTFADRWKHCSLWTQRLTFEENAIQSIGAAKQLTTSKDHLLGRCRPIKHHDNLYLPLYNEVTGQGVLYQSTPTKDLTRVSDFGKEMIQPTFWMDGDRLCSLSRTFHSANRFAPYYYSDDDGKTWVGPAATTIKNRNNSLHALALGEHNLLVWNDTDSLRRQNLTLGTLTHDKIPKVNPLALISDHGSYPTLCDDSAGRVCLSYTTVQGKIKYYVWSKPKITDAIGRRNFAGRSDGAADAATDAATSGTEDSALL